MNIIALDTLLDRPIAFNRIFAKISGGLVSGIILSQLYYWSKIKSHTEFYKTNEEIMEECFVGRDAFYTAIKKIEGLGIFERIKKGMPAKTFYKINLAKLIEIIDNLSNVDNKLSSNQDNQITSTPENSSTSNPDSCTTSDPEVRNTSTPETCSALNITETTTENTTKTTLKNSKKKTDEAIDLIVNYYETKTNISLNKNTSTYQAITDNNTKVLNKYTVEDCNAVINFIVTDPWYIANNQTGLDVIFRPSKFGDKLLRASKKQTTYSVDPVNRSPDEQIVIPEFARMDE